MLYLTVLFFLLAIIFGAIGIGDVGGFASATANILFVLAFVSLLTSLAASLFPLPKGFYGKRSRPRQDRVERS